MTSALVSISRRRWRYLSLYMLVVGWLAPSSLQADHAADSPARQEKRASVPTPPQGPEQSRYPRLDLTDLPPACSRDEKAAWIRRTFLKKKEQAFYAPYRQAAWYGLVYGIVWVGLALVELKSGMLHKLITEKIAPFGEFLSILLVLIAGPPTVVQQGLHDPEIAFREVVIAFGLYMAVFGVLVYSAPCWKESRLFTKVICAILIPSLAPFFPWPDWLLLGIADKEPSPRQITSRIVSLFWGGLLLWKATDSKAAHAIKILWFTEKPVDPLAKTEAAYMVARELDMGDGYADYQQAIEKALKKRDRGGTSVNDTITRVQSLLSLFYATAPGLRQQISAPCKAELVRQAEQILKHYDVTVRDTLKRWFFALLDGIHHEPLLLAGHEGCGKTRAISELAQLLPPEEVVVFLRTGGKSGAEAREALAAALIQAGQQGKHVLAVVFDEIDKELEEEGKHSFYLNVCNGANEETMFFPHWEVNADFPMKLILISNDTNKLSKPLKDRGTPLFFQGYSPANRWEIFAGSKLVEIARAEGVLLSSLTLPDQEEIKRLIKQEGAGSLRAPEKAVEAYLKEKKLAWLLASSLMATSTQADPGPAGRKSQQAEKESASHRSREKKAACIRKAFLQKKRRRLHRYYTRKCLILVARSCLFALLTCAQIWIAAAIRSKYTAFKGNVRAQVLPDNNVNGDQNKVSLYLWVALTICRAAVTFGWEISSDSLVSGLIDDHVPMPVWYALKCLRYLLLSADQADKKGDNSSAALQKPKGRPLFNRVRQFISVLETGITLFYFLYTELIAIDQGVSTWDVLVHGKFPPDPLEKYELTYAVLKHLEMASYPAWQAAIEEAFAKGDRDPAAVEEAIQQVDYLLGIFYATAPELRKTAGKEEQREILRKAERILEDYDPEIAKTLECWLMQTLEGREQRPLLLVGEPGYGKTYLVKELCKLLQEWGELGVIYTEGRQSNTAAIAENLALTGANEKQTIALLFDEIDKTIHLPGMLVAYLLLGDATEKGRLTIPGAPIQMHLPNQFWICNTKKEFPPELLARTVPLEFTGFTPDQLWNIFRKGKLAEFVKAANLPPDCLTEADLTHIRAALGKIKSGGMRDGERVVRDYLVQKRMDLVSAA